MLDDRHISVSLYSSFIILCVASFNPNDRDTQTILHETVASRTAFVKQGLLLSSLIIQHNCIKTLLSRERERETLKETPAAKWKRKECGIAKKKKKE